MSATKIYIGIDPGENGAAAIYSENWGDVVTIKRNHEVCEWVNTIRNEWGSEVVVAIERVQMWTKDDFAKQFVMQKLFRQQSEMVGYLRGVGCHVEEVHPRTWQKHYPTPKGISKKERKAAYRDKAQELWPFNKANLRNSDALLILHYLINQIK